MGGDLRRNASEVRYARVDDAHVAYRVIAGDTGETRDVVWLLAGTMSMEALFDDPVALRLVDGLAEFGRLIVFDRRGIGLSDPPADWQAPDSRRWSDDLEAVIAAAHVNQPTLVSNNRSWKAAVVYCDRHPHDVAGIVMFEPSTVRSDSTFTQGQIAGEIDSVAVFCPSRADEPGFREWFAQAGRVGASPTMAARAYRVEDDDEVREIEQAASGIVVPTLVLRRPACRTARVSPAHALSPDPARDPILSLVPGAERIDLPGEDHAIYGGEVDALLGEVARFVTGEHRLLSPERVLAAVLFCDVVASTDRAMALGDAHWKRVLDRHDDISRSCIARRGGTVIKTMGDGFLALFPSANSAFAAAVDLRGALEHENLDVRIGIHVGDVDRRGDDISGIGVVTAERIESVAETGEILASASAVQAANGGPHHFEPRGEHQLKGLAGTWQLFALAPSSPQTRT